MTRYDYYGVCDPMRNLVPALITNDEERNSLQIIFGRPRIIPRTRRQAVSGGLANMTNTWNILRKDSGITFSRILNSFTTTQTKDEVKALAFAEQARVKCRKDLDEVYIYMLTCAMKKDDIEEIKRLLRSAKVQSGADYDHIVVAAGAGEGMRLRYEEKERGKKNVRTLEDGLEVVSG